MINVTYDEMEAEVRREHALRQRVYDKWVRLGTMTPHDAATHQGRMAAIVEMMREMRENRDNLPPSIFAPRTIK